MNIGDLKARRELEDEGVEIPIQDKAGDYYLGPDGEPSTITVVGSESLKYKAAKHAQYRRMSKRVRGGRSEPSPEELERDAVDLAAAAVMGFKGWEQDGKELPFTPENVRALLGFDHILEQVNGGIARHASFFGGE